MSDESSRLHEQPSLTGEKVYLRPTTPEDIRAKYLWSLLTDPQSQTCRPWVYGSAEEAVEAYRARTKSDQQQSFTVCRKEDGTPVGSVSFFSLNTLNRSAELGLLTNPEEQRRGYAIEAMRILVSYLFRHRGLNKVYAQTSGLNNATAALLEKLGFTRDAVLREHYFLNGAFHPGYVYSLLSRELNS